MEEQLISLETAKLAKEKKFDIYCKVGFIEQLEDKNCLLIEPGIEVDYLWEPSFEEPEDYWQAVLDMDQPEIKYYPRPTQSLLQKWLREIYDIHIQILPYNHKYLVSILKYDQNGSNPNFDKKFNTYEKALEKGLQEALKLI